MNRINSAGTYVYVLLFALAGLLAACSGTPPPVTVTPPATATAVPTLVPTSTSYTLPTLNPTDTPVPVTPTITPVIVDSLMGISVPVPISINIPEGWEYAYDTVIYKNLLELDTIPFAIYRGVVSGGRGSIVVLWNFGSVLATDPNNAFSQPNLWLDGQRLLRAIVVEPACNVGVDVPYDFTIGSQQATGTYWSAIDCPDGLPDIRGWFAGVRVNEVNFLFYVYGDPIDVMDGNAPQEMQAILNSVEFHVDEFIATAEAASTQAIQETQAAGSFLVPTPTATPQ